MDFVQDDVTELALDMKVGIWVDSRLVGSYEVRWMGWWDSELVYPARLGCIVALNLTPNLGSGPPIDTDTRHRTACLPFAGRSNSLRQHAHGGHDQGPQGQGGPRRGRRRRRRNGRRWAQETQIRRECELRAQIKRKERMKEGGREGQRIECDLDSPRPADPFCEFLHNDFAFL